MGMTKAERLTKAFEILNEANVFRPGDIVEWKEMCQNKGLESPFIVTEILEERIFDSENDSGSPYFREALDMKIGYITDDGDFLEAYVDSRRFQKV